jgi:hypothetical protein
MIIRAKSGIPVRPVPASRNVNVAGQVSNRIESFNKLVPAKVADVPAPQSVQDIQNVKSAVPIGNQETTQNNIQMNPQERQTAIARMLKKGGM